MRSCGQELALHAVDFGFVGDVTQIQNMRNPGRVRLAQGDFQHRLVGVGQLDHVPRDRAAGLSPTVRKVASGAAETTPLIHVVNLARTLRHLKDRGIWVVGAAGEADMDLYAADLKGPLAIVMGSEGEGLRRLTREHCDSLVRIPMAGSVESLNVSVATGVLLFEATRQRRPAQAPGKR